MKKNIFLLGFTAIALLTSCGGSGSSGEAKSAEEVAEKIIETSAFGQRTKEAADAAFKAIGLSISDVAPEFKYLEADTIKAYRGVIYQGTYEASAVFIKEDMSDVSREEFEKYVRYIYAQTQKISDDGKVIYGFEKRSKAEEANAEWSVDEILAQNILGFPMSFYDWGFKKDGKYMRMSVELLDANKKYPAREEVHFYQALQKSMEETMKDVEKALEDPEVQKAVKDALK